MSDRILIVDDEKDVCSVVKETLEHEGFMVDAAYNGEQAMDFLESQLYGLILVDIRLEGRITGIEVMKACRHAKGNPKVGIISATPFNLLKPILEGEGVESMVSGALEKPVDLRPDRFVKIIKGLYNISKEGRA